MLKLEQYQKLKKGDQIRYSKDIYTVHGHEEFASHRECKLISDSGAVLHNGIYIIHLMAFHGSVDLVGGTTPQKEARIAAPALALDVVAVAEKLSVEVAKPLISDADSSLLALYLAAERV